MIDLSSAIVQPDIVSVEVHQVVSSAAMAIVVVRLIAEDGRTYPQDGAVLQLRFMPDGGGGAVAEKLVINPKPKGFADAVLVDTDVMALAYEEVLAAHRSGKDEAAGRKAVERWLVKNKRVPAGKVS